MRSERYDGERRAGRVSRITGVSPVAGKAFRSAVGDLLGLRGLRAFATGSRANRCILWYSGCRGTRVTVSLGESVAGAGFLPSHSRCAVESDVSRAAGGIVKERPVRIGPWQCSKSYTAFHGQASPPLADVLGRATTGVAVRGGGAIMPDIRKGIPGPVRRWLARLGPGEHFHR